MVDGLLTAFETSPEQEEDSRRAVILSKDAIAAGVPADVLMYWRKAHLLAPTCNEGDSAALVASDTQDQEIVALVASSTPPSFLIQAKNWCVRRIPFNGHLINP